MTKLDPRGLDRWAGVLACAHEQALGVRAELVNPAAGLLPNTASCQAAATR